MAMSRLVQPTATNGQWAKHFLYAQIFGSLPLPTKSFAGQTIIVTGGNSGLGLEAVRHFTRLDAAKVILACRTKEKGQQAAASIAESEKRPGVVEVWELDLASYESTKRFASRVDAELDRLDVFVANAGVYLYDFKRVEEDEETITVNVVTTLLLGMLVLPKLRETSIKHQKQTVLTFVGSFVHHHTSFPEADSHNIFEALNDEKTARMNDRYNVSKAMLLFSVRELAARMTASNQPGNIVTSFLNPGYVKTSIMRNNHSAAFKAFMVVWSRVASRSAEVGARTLVFAAYGGAETHGRYLDDCTVGRAAVYIVSERGQKIQARLWAELSKKLERISPGVMSLI